MTTRRTRRAAAFAAASAALALTAMLSGCGLISGGNSGGPDVPADLVLHPSGDEGAWMLNGYSAGTSGEWVSDDMLCGIRDGIAIHRDLTDRAVTLIATDLATGSDLWRLETETPGGVNCAPVLDDRLYTSESEMNANGDYRSIVVRVDLATGERTNIYEAPINISILTAFAHEGETAYALAAADAGEVLLAFDGAGQIAWQAPMSAVAECHLLSGHIACVDMMTTEYTILDAATGEITASGSSPSDPNDLVNFAADGFALTTDRVSFTEATYTGYDFDGNEIGELDSARGPGMPSALDGVFYELDDFNYWTIAAVDSAGTPVLKLPGGLDNGLDSVATGKNFPDIELDAVSADGQTIVTAPFGAPALILDLDANTIAELPSGDGIRTIGGYLTSTRDSGSVVYLPAG
ncbi:hypothetical protein [Microbacterium sp. A94]|uniref:hypothetical protein n=1 Tax=Microbacterium sp. A94 TaxID=3450717 RepID=UPI003F42C29C